MFCKCCGKVIHESATSCPHCGGLQQVAAQVATAAAGMPWLAIASLVLGIMCVLTFFDDSGWDNDTVLGLAILALAGIGTGVGSLGKQRSGMAIAGVVMSTIGFLAAIGMMLE